MPEIETARLRLRQFTDSDLEYYARLYSNPEYTRYSPKGAVPLEQAKEASQAAYNYFISHWRKHGFGVWAVVDRVNQNNKIIGQCGLNCLPDSDEVEVLYRLDQPYWNQGLTTEATKASLRYGFEQVKLDQIVALTLPEHFASRRVMEKARMRYEKDAHIYRLNVVYYVLYRTAYQPDNFLYRLIQKLEIESVKKVNN
jgi:ribosomal-protein-alanine N-acetyltransferase